MLLVLPFLANMLLVPFSKVQYGASYIFLLICPPNFTRLSTTYDEVIVYPIPAALYLVKNLLQVYFCPF